MHEHDGHRDRLREKLDAGVLQDHEYLEILLYTAMPRRNTNDVAHRLLSEFGTVTGVFSASYHDLLRVKGVGTSLAGFISSLGNLLAKYYGQRFTAYRGEYDRETFTTYIKKMYGFEEREILDVYLLDEAKTVLTNKVFSRGRADRVELDPTAFSRLLTEYKPAGVILVHNHPGGDPSPSEQDDETTIKFQIACSYHNVMLCDHYICAKEGVYSYVDEHKLQAISEKYSVQAIAKKE